MGGEYFPAFPALILKKNLKFSEAKFLVFLVLGLYAHTV